MVMMSFVTYVLLACCAVAILADPVNKDFSNPDDPSKKTCATYVLTYSAVLGICTSVKETCEGERIVEKYRGPCKDSQPCLVSLRYARKMKLSGGSTFMPKCRADGSYAPVQCHRDNGCWCVTSQGKSVPDTSVRNGRPKCRREVSNSRRRSPSRGHRNREGCGRVDKAHFNSNLRSTLTTDYNRENVVMLLVQGKEKEKLVVEWKFNSLDSNSDSSLDKSEYSSFTKLIRKVVKPKRCAKLFVETCDVNQDEVITKQEWINCITDNTHNYEGGGRAPGADRGRSTYDDRSQERGRIDDDDDDEDVGAKGVLQGSVTKMNGNSPGFNDDSLDRNRDDGDSNDCLYDRKTALDNQKNGDSVLYVPECTADGRFERMQCYPNTGYCWCVSEDTGKPIPGTSIKGKLPDCDSLPVPNRPMKGCSEQKKAEFLKDLMETLKNQMAATTNGSEIVGSSDSMKWQASKEEQVALWSFVMWDKNKNKFLEKREWKLFRKFVSGNSLLQQCGKRLPRYCDVNNDQKINTTEWLNCLNAKRKTSTETTSPKSTTVPKRKGPNPLESFLKGD